MSDMANSNKLPAGPETHLDEAIQALQAVVSAQKEQIDALLMSLEGLLAAINQSDKTAQADQQPRPSQPAKVEPSGLLGDPLDQQFATLHQLMARLSSS